MRIKNINTQCGTGKIPPYPLRQITPEERDNAFMKLRKLKFNTGDKPNLSQVGNKASNYYFQLHRAKTKTGKWSHWDKWRDDKQRAKIKAIDKQINRKNINIIGTPTGLQSALRLSGNSVNQFKPYIAVYIYQLLKPKKIIDITAGWGDRLVGAMSQNIDYVGIDTNTSLKHSYEKMIKHFSKFTESTANMIFKKAENVDYTKLKPYDLIFTSPPYFSLEQYRGMEKFENDAQFVEKFFIPAIRKSYNSLSRGGHMALNMPEEMANILIPIYGRPRCVKMPIHNRLAFKNDKKIFECIYIWNKR